MGRNSSFQETTTVIYTPKKKVDNLESTVTQSPNLCFYTFLIRVTEL